KKTLRCHVPEGFFALKNRFRQTSFFKTNAVLNANFSARLGVQVLTQLAIFWFEIIKRMRTIPPLFLG
ncbi:hypothetical protein ACFS07_32450, partial [Undibacterium arcticum]